MVYASDVRVGTVLSQSNEEGMDYPVVYFSRKLLPRKQKYAVIKRNAMPAQIPSPGSQFP